MGGPVVENIEKGQSVQRMVKGLRTMSENMTPDELFEELIKSIKRYHPSGDISMVERHTKLLRMLMRVSSVNPENHISFILFVLPLF